MSGKYTQQELCNAVYFAVIQSEKPLSRLEICRAIGRKKSPHILTMIEHLVNTGFFSRCHGRDKFGRQMWLYAGSAGTPNGVPCSEWQNEVQSEAVLL